MPKMLIPCLAIVGLVVIEIVAMIHDIDGVALATICTLIAGLGGFTLGKVLPK
jgi:hypothetical protein